MEDRAKENEEEESDFNKGKEEPEFGHKAHSIVILVKTVRTLGRREIES
jgi:hypothetical protein